MWRPLWFLSLLLMPALAHARWSVELRPLEQRPYRRAFPTLIAVHAQSNLSRLEGSGVELAASGASTVFDVPLPPAAEPRELELNLGYLTDGALPPGAGACALTLTAEGAEPATRSVELPLRSVEPATLPLDEVRARYDYLTPEVRWAVAPGATRLALRVRPAAACRAGRLIALNPKVWRKISDAKPKRLVFIPSDSISGDWFDEGRRLMPFVQDYFARPGARWTSRAVSVASNTHDTTHIIDIMQLYLRDGEAVRGFPASPGLTPAFLEAGYEVLSFNSNLLLAATWQPAGFRHLFNLNAAGSEVNDRNPEILTEMMLDWLRRHPEHDIFFYTWFDATHSGAPAPRWRPEIEQEKLLRRAPEWSAGKMANQARGMSYVDLVLEAFLSDPSLAEADVLFFADHGLNFDTLDHPKPLWGRCSPREAPSNWHLAPEELRIPVGVRVQGWDPGPIAHETSLLDWVYSAVKHHNPAIDIAGFGGRDLAAVRADDPMVAVSHGRRGAIRLGGRHFVFEDACISGEGATFLDAALQPVGEADLARLEQALTSQGMMLYRSLTVEAFHGRGECPVEIRLPSSFLPDGSAAAPSLSLDPSRWFSRLAVFVPATTPGTYKRLAINSGADGCVEAQAGYVRKRLPKTFDFAGSGLWSLAQVAGPELGVGGHAAIRVVHPGRAYRRTATGFTAEAAASTQKSELSREVRAAMKLWGYIQDDQTQQ